MQQPVAEGDKDAPRIERGFGVVAQKLRIAEDEAGLCVVERIPAGQRDHAAYEPCSLTPMPGTIQPRAADCFHQAHGSQRQRYGYRRLLAQCRGGEP